MGDVMSKSKSSVPQWNVILVGALSVMLMLTLIFVILTTARVNRLHQFFNTFSADYRSLSNANPQPAAPAVAGTPAAGAPAAGEAQNNCVDVSNVDFSSDPSLGDPNAPVTIVEYSDFECPFCSRFATGAYPLIKSKYVDSGQVRIIFKDYPLDSAHPLAIPTAVLANCVAAEFGDETFFAYHDQVFLQQSALSNRNIRTWASDLGLSDNQIEACLEDSSLVDEILADRTEGSRLGITGTPSFVVNGELLIGAQPFAVFEQSIENALAGAGCEG